MMNVRMNCGAYSKSIGMVASREQANQRHEYLMNEYNHLVSLANIVLGPVNTIAGNAVIDAKNMLYKRKDLWKHQVKFYAHKAEDEYYKYERMHTSNFDNKYNLFLDYLDAVASEIAKDVQMLKLSIHQALLNKKQSDAALKAEIETAWVLTRYACCVFDEMMKEAKRRTGFDYKPFFIKGRLTSTFHYWDCVDKLICKSDKGTGKIDFGEDDNCQLAFRIIEKKVMSEEMLNKAGYEALKQNMELVGDSVSIEEFKELEEKFNNKK